MLPARGEVLVAPGDRVEPDDLVARCQIPGRLHLVDLLEEMGGRRRTRAILLHKVAGDAVQAGELLAELRGPLAWRWRAIVGCRAPVNGRVVAVRPGRVLIETTSVTFALRARMRGEVSSLIPERGVVLSAAGAWLQGVWASGGEAHGVLRVVSADPGEPLSAAVAAGDLAGALLVAGQLVQEDALAFAAEAGVRGIIVGGLSAELCRLRRPWPCPVLVTDGFGSVPMSRQAFSLLRSCSGREAMLDAAMPEDWATRRPQVLVPIAAEDPALPKAQDPQPLQVGTQVRGLRAPHLGVVGTVTALPTRPQPVETGAWLPAAQVVLEGGETVSIPWANLEIGS